jgi:hypothetical protein
MSDAYSSTSEMWPYQRWTKRQSTWRLGGYIQLLPQPPVTDKEEGVKPIWIVVQQWPGGKERMVAAYLSEENARAAAGRQVGKDGALVALYNVLLEDWSDVTWSADQMENQREMYPRAEKSNEIK